MKKKEDESVI